MIGSRLKAEGQRLKETRRRPNRAGLCRGKQGKRKRHGAEREAQSSMLKAERWLLKVSVLRVEVRLKISSFHLPCSAIDYFRLPAL